MKFRIVDVFTDSLFGGNPAGVVLIPDDRDFPEDEIMRKTAAELRYSETAFVKQLSDRSFRTRYFTPAAEVDLCGHATIGTFYTLMESGIIKAGGTYVNETLAGTLEIAVEKETILMDMADPRIFESIDGEEALDELYGVMGISSEGQGCCLKDGAIRLIPKKVSTGLVDIMMPVKSQEELDKISPDFKALTALSDRYGVVGVHAFTCNTEDGCIHARNFAPLYEIDEEAATGTSNGALTYYLYDYGIVRPQEINTVIQGEKMGRPSRISTRLVIEDGKTGVKVGGFAVTLAQGEIEL